MKKYSILAMAFTLLALGSCKDEEWVRIDSLQVFGDEFYQGATVDLGMSVETSNPDVNYYEWFCEEGSLRLSQQGYTVMKWTAPKKSGNFTVGCTVHCGSKKETRYATIKVTGLFFDRFAGSTLTNWSNSASSPAKRGNRLETQVSPSNNLDSLGYVYKAIGATDFYPPASVNASVGIIGGNTNVNNPKFPVSTPPPVSGGSGLISRDKWDNFMGFGMTGSDPGADISPTYWISEVRVDWWPYGSMQPIHTYCAPEDDPDLPASRTIAAADFNARIAVKWTHRANIAGGVAAYDGWFMVYFKHAAFTHGLDVNKVVGVAVDEDYNVIVGVDGAQVFTTDAIRKWTENQPDSYLKVNQVKYVYPNYTYVYMNYVTSDNSTDFLN